MNTFNLALTSQSLYNLKKNNDDTNTKFDFDKNQTLYKTNVLLPLIIKIISLFCKKLNKTNTNDLFFYKDSLLIPLVTKFSLIENYTNPLLFLLCECLTDIKNIINVSGLSTNHTKNSNIHSTIKYIITIWNQCVNILNYQIFSKKTLNVNHNTNVNFDKIVDGITNNNNNDDDNDENNHKFIISSLKLILSLIK